MKRFVIGSWYDSQRDVRVPTRNPAKGIAEWKGRLFIIVTYHGSRRAPYEDRLDLKEGRLSYVGHGRVGNQKRDYWNRLLMAAQQKQTPVNVFLDCGDLFRPKQLLYAGEWTVRRWQTRTEQNRSVFRFTLGPQSRSALQQLRDVVLFPEGNRQFERAAPVFGRQRQKFYSRFKGVLRSKDNLAGSVGEYWGIATFNKHCGGRPLIRCSSSFRDIDAIQAGTNNGFAIKTVTRFPVLSSSIWSEEFAHANAPRRRGKGPRRRSGPAADINNFLIVVLDDYLMPRFIGHIPARVAKRFSKADQYQGSTKLNICEDLVQHRRMRVLHGNAQALCVRNSS